MKRVVIAGLTIWVVATVALRAAGQWVIRPDRLAAVAMLLVLSAPAMFALPRRLFRRLGLPYAEYPRGVIALVAPGMVLDAVSTIWFVDVFPNMGSDAAGLFGGWLLLCNVCALLGAATVRPVTQLSGESERRG